MSPRPRTVPDEQVLAAAQRTMSRLGPARWTLAEVAKDAGLSPATLVQRFGSKRGLMLALWAAAVAGVDACFEALRPASASPLDALLAAATMMSRHTKSPEEMANHLAYLQIDVSDPEFHPHMLVMSQRTEAGYRALLDEAVTAQEIVPCETARLARAISAMAGGSLISWAVFREGTAESWVRGDLETLLAAYRPARASKRKRKSTSRRKGESGSSKGRRRR
jgi:AcrR family transcriptional regulator